MEVTEQQFAISIAQMHAVALTIAEILAISAFASAHPLTVAIGGITILPDFHEVVLVDISLIVICTDAGTGSNRAIGHY